MKRINSKMIQRMTVMLVFPFFFFLGPAASMDLNTAYVSGMAQLRCHFSNPKNYSIQQLCMSWERQGTIVVAELCDGERKYTSVTDSYRNRTMEYMPNGDIQMFNITLQDKGAYKCVIRRRIGNIEIIHMFAYTLNVVGNFSAPQVTGSPPVVKKDMVVRYRCSSTDGFPKPYGITWTVSDENGTQFHSRICNLEFGPSCTIRNHSETFNISSELTLRIKGNTSITCTVLAHHNFSSVTLHIAVENEPILQNEENDNLKYIVPSVILIVIAIVGVAYFACRMNGKRSTLRLLQNNRETPTTPATNASVTQQQDETTSFIPNGVEVNV